jgi:hypothetical protein
MVFRPFFILVFAFCHNAAHSQTIDADSGSPRQYFSLQGGLTLLEAPVVFYPNVGINYSKTIWGKKTHQLAINPQFQFITIPKIEQKFLLAATAEYKFQPKWRFEASVFAGVNYQLRKFNYDRLAFQNGNLENIGSVKHQVGPVLGFHLGYKIFRKNAYSISPYFGFSLTKLRDSYTNTFTDGFVPTAFLGIKANLNK